MRYIFVALLLGLVVSASLQAQSDTAMVYVWPSEIYPGENVITINSVNGIQEITTTRSSDVTVTGEGTFRCDKERELRVTVYSASGSAEVNVQIRDCRGRLFTATLRLNMSWTVDAVSFGTLEEGETACQTFHIRSGVDLTGSGEPVVLEEVTAEDDRVAMEHYVALPHRITPGTTYTYKVCFTADEPGVYTFPVITWLRRRFPTGGQTIYPVADTGIVRVIPRIAVDEGPVTDPTGFRSVVTPNAVIPKKGSFFLGSYDFFGVIGGYAVTDNAMLLVGGGIPTPDDWSGVRGDMFGAYSLGVKGGFGIGDKLDIAAGYQWAQSIYDREETPDALESRITVNAPYLAVSYGDDDARLSLLGGYALKHHVRPDNEFDDNAAFLAIGGDYRIGKNWKLAGEVVGLQNLGILPVVATARYFSNTYAIDFGIALLGIKTGDGPAPKIPVAPVISGVFVW